MTVAALAIAIYKTHVQVIFQDAQSQLCGITRSSFGTTHQISTTNRRRCWVPNSTRFPKLLTSWKPNCTNSQSFRCPRSCCLRPCPACFRSGSPPLPGRGWCRGPLVCPEVSTPQSDLRRPSATQKLLGAWCSLSPSSSLPTLLPSAVFRESQDLALTNCSPLPLPVAQARKRPCSWQSPRRISEH